MRAACGSVFLLGLFLAGSARAQCEVDKLVGLDTLDGDRLGGAVAVDGFVAIVGAEREDSAAANAGAAWVFRFDGFSWVPEQKLTASDAGSNDHFGQTVAIRGNVAVVGSPDDDDAGSRSGSAYVYRFDGTTWTQEQKLVAGDAAASDRFGWSVGVDGTAIAIGAKFNDGAIADGGAAYVFRYDGTSWSQEQKLTASDAANIAQFGDAIAIDGAAVVVGAWQDDDDGTFSGSAYVFRFDGTSWAEEQKLTASDAAAFRWFGRSVAIESDVVVAGAYGDAAGGSEAGAAYVYRYDGTSWSEEQKLVASDAAANDRFGWAAAVEGSRAIVGAYQAGTGGAFYVFTESGGVWSEDAIVDAADTAGGDDFGRSVALGTEFAVAGAWNNAAVGTSGAAYAFAFGSDCDVGTAYCFGTPGDCPCANGGAADTGCDNSQGTGGARLAGVGKPAQNSVVLRGSGFPPMASPTVIVIRAPAAEAPPVAFGDGLRCVGLSGLTRFGATAASGGSSSHAVNHGAGAGSFFYQLWYRNTPASFCDATAAFNLSNGLSIDWP